MRRITNKSGISEKGSKNLAGLKLPIWIGDRRVVNRVVHQPVECNDFFGGFPSEPTLRRYRRLAEGRAGITVVEATSVVSSSRSRLHQLIADEQHRKAIEKLTHEFKKVNQHTILCYQLTHTGQLSNPRFSKVVRIYGCKDFDDTAGKILQTDEIRQIRNAFINGAEIVHDSGADMVDIKLCHGFFGNQIIRPANIRNDEYGRTLENRMRFVKEVVEGIRERITDSNFKIMVRFSIYEGDARINEKPVMGGIGTKGPESTEFSLREPYKMLKMLVSYGVDILNITIGGKWSIPKKIPGELEIEKPDSYLIYPHLDFARRVKALKLGVPVICTGFSVFGKNIARVGCDSISRGYADMVGIGRQTLADPDIERILDGSAKYCKRCNGCHELLVAQMPVGCTYYDPFYAALRQSTKLNFTAP